MTARKFLDNYWRYYLVLEKQFSDLTRYVELSLDNFSTYSIEFVHQIQSICSEIDVMMKVMSGYNSTERKCIADYAAQILPNYPDIINWEVKVRDISFKPYDGWSASAAASSLSWWEAYNDVKHGRDGNYKKASLENTLKSLMGLYLIEMIYFKKLADTEGKPDVLPKESELFTITGWSNRYISLSKHAIRMDNGDVHIDEVKFD